MDSTIHETTSADFSPDDGAFVRALADLDTKLAAWTAAMQEAHARLRIIADRDTQRSVIQQPVIAEEEPAITQPEDRQTRHVELEPVEKEDEQKPTGEKQITPATLSRLKEPGPDIHTGSDQGLEPTPDSPAGTDQPAAWTRDQDEDEALLASLDAETAQAICIMRRLSLEKKNVRELLRQYQATELVHKAARPQKRSWFKRKVEQ